MGQASVKHCKICLPKGIEKKARTLCHECIQFLCKECSDAHLLHTHHDHHLLDLDPPGKESKQVNEEKLAADFLNQATVSETTVLYQPMTQVAVGTWAPGRDVQTEVKDTHVDVKSVKVRKCLDFSIKRGEDREEVEVTGIIEITDKVVAVDCANSKLKLYDKSGTYLSSADCGWLLMSDITRVHDNKFATCGDGGKVLLWRVSGKRIVRDDVTYDVDHDACSIDYNGTYFCVLHYAENTITVLDRQGKRIRKIVKKEVMGKKIKFGFDLHVDNDNNSIYMHCRLDQIGVLCLTIEGEVLWYSPLQKGLVGITEIYGVLCVADFHDKCLHLISKTGKYEGKLLDKDDIGGDPSNVFYNEGGQKLYVGRSMHGEKRDIISVYHVE